MRRVGVVGQRGTGRVGSDSRPTGWYWLLSRTGVSGLEVFTEMMPKGEGIVPVFSSADGARDYLSEGAVPWKPRKTSRGELISLLMGVCKDARWVALDPPPGAATVRFDRLDSPEKAAMGSSARLEGTIQVEAKDWSVSGSFNTGYCPDLLRFCI